MANFATHLNVSAFVSAIASVSISTSKEDVLLYFSAGIIGGILPDIDHDKSTPIKIISFFFSNLIAFLVSYKYIGKIPILNILLIWIITYLLMSVFFYFFKKITKHRGIIHSIPAGMLFWFITSMISNKLFDFDIHKSYLIGFFIFLGYMTHLLLDEIYSVDITGRRIKKSFGSALKICSNDKTVNLLIYTILILLFITLPNKYVFIHIIKGIINV